MHERGKVKFWNDAGGYGFIRVEFDRGVNSRTGKTEAKNVSVVEGGSHA